MAEREFRLPDLGEGLEDAEVVRWLVAEGDEVTLNQPLAEVDTAKALVEIPSPVAGKVLRLHASEGEVVEVGAPLVTFEVEGAELPTTSRSVLVGYGVEESTKPPRRRRLRSSAETSPVPSKPEKVLAAPPVRKLAADLGVELASVSGSGAGGRITREDVIEAAGAVPGSVETTPAGDEERIQITGVRRRVAQKMARAASEIPHVTTFLTVDATELLAARVTAQANSSALKITPLAVVARAFTEILKDHPKLNASLDSERGEIVLKRYCHLGIAADTERGLLVVVVRDASSKSVPEIASEIARLSAAARDGTASPEDLSGSTVTISNVGSFGAEFGTPIINFPETAILALGVINERPAAVGGRIEVRPLVTLSLSFDHRVLDGAEAGRAMGDLKDLLEDAAALARLL